MRSNASTMVKTYSCGYPRDLGRPPATRLPFVSTTSTVTFGRPSASRLPFVSTTSTVTVELAVVVV